MEKTKKPKCKLIGKNGNVFNLLGIAKETLKKHKMYKEAKEMVDKAFNANSYSEALSIISKYLEIY